MRFLIVTEIAGTKMYIRRLNKNRVSVLISDVTGAYDFGSIKEATKTLKSINNTRYTIETI